MLLSDLDELEDILDLIIPYDDTNEEKNYFNEEEECDIIENCMQLMFDYITENSTEISEPDFHDTMIENIKQIYSSIIIPEIKNDIDDIDEIYDDLDELIDVATELFYIQIIPPRSFPTTFIRQIPNGKQIQALKNKLNYLENKPQPPQRTAEWYSFRYNLITASNAYRAFENQNTQNQLIYEKCQPLTTSQTDKFSFVNVDTTLHWGVKNMNPFRLCIMKKNIIQKLATLDVFNMINIIF